MYNNNYSVIDKDGKLLDEAKGTNCFFGLRQFYEKQKDFNSPIATIWSNKKEIDYDLEEIEKYIALINSIGIFKIEYRYSDKEDVCYFTINPKDYDCIGYWVGATMSIRYLWEKGGDNFNDIPGYLIKLNDKYPDKDMLYKLIWAHTYLAYEEKAKWYNSNHSLVTGKLFYPIIKAELSKGKVTNECFTSKQKKDYNREMKEYYEELKAL